MSNEKIPVILQVTEFYDEDYHRDPQGRFSAKGELSGYYISKESSDKLQSSVDQLSKTLEQTKKESKKRALKIENLSNHVDKLQHDLYATRKEKEMLKVKIANSKKSHNNLHGKYLQTVINLDELEGRHPKALAGFSALFFVLGVIVTFVAAELFDTF